jgi:hypothetical protein
LPPPSALGAVTPLPPSPTLQPSTPLTPHILKLLPPPSNLPRPACNPAIQLQARDRLAQEAEQEFIDVGKRGHEGRQFLDVVTIRQLLMLRDEKGLERTEIERRLGLRRGRWGGWGGRGLWATRVCDAGLMERGVYKMRGMGLYDFIACNAGL